MADCAGENKAQEGKRELTFQVAEDIPSFSNLRMENFQLHLSLLNPNATMFDLKF